jgi:hypothetical protein
LESFAGKRVSSSEDRLEETKRRKLAIKARKLVELMMVSGIPTASGFEERIRFSEIEIVDANAIDTGVQYNLPEGNYISGWDINVAGVRVTTTKGKLRHHKHAEFILRIKRKGELEHFVARRYGDFSRLHRRLRLELPGRTLPALPKKNKSDSTASGLLSAFSSSKDEEDSDASSDESTTSRRTGLSKLSQVPTDGARASPNSLLTPGDGGEEYKALILTRTVANKLLDQVVAKEALPLLSGPVCQEVNPPGHPPMVASPPWWEERRKRFVKQLNLFRLLTNLP